MKFRRLFRRVARRDVKNDDQETIQLAVISSHLSSTTDKSVAGDDNKTHALAPRVSRFKPKALISKVATKFRHKERSEVEQSSGYTYTTNFFSSEDQLAPNPCTEFGKEGLEASEWRTVKSYLASPVVDIEATTPVNGGQCSAIKTLEAERPKLSKPTCVAREDVLHPKAGSETHEDNSSSAASPQSSRRPSTPGTSCDQREQHEQESPQSGVSLQKREDRNDAAKSLNDVESVEGPMKVRKCNMPAAANVPMPVESPTQPLTPLAPTSHVDEISSFNLPVSIKVPGQASVLVTLEWLEDYQRYRFERLAQEAALDWAQKARISCRRSIGHIDEYLGYCQTLEGGVLECSIRKPQWCVSRLRKIFEFQGGLKERQSSLLRLETLVNGNINMLRTRRLDVDVMNRIAYACMRFVDKLDPNSEDSCFTPTSMLTKLEEMCVAIGDESISDDDRQGYVTHSVYQRFAPFLNSRDWSHPLGPRQSVNNDLRFYAEGLRRVEERLDSISSHRTGTCAISGSIEHTSASELLASSESDLQKELKPPWYFLKASMAVAKHRVNYIPQTRPWDEDHTSDVDEDGRNESQDRHQYNTLVGSANSTCSCDWTCPNDQEHFAEGCRHCWYKPFMDPYQVPEEAMHHGDNRIRAWLPNIVGGSDFMEAPEIDFWLYEEMDLFNNNWDELEEYWLLYAVLEGIKRGYLMQTATMGYMKTTRYPVASEGLLLQDRGAPERFLIEAYGIDATGGWCEIPPSSPREAAVHFSRYGIIQANSLKGAEIDEDLPFEENGTLMEDDDDDFGVPWHPHPKYINCQRMTAG